MQLFDTDISYSTISKVFHWLRLILLVVVFLLPERDIVLHNSLGFVLFILIFFNIIWRLLNKYPKSYAKSQIEKNIASLIHVFLYTILFLLPILGYFSTPYSIKLGILEIPSAYDIELIKNFIANKFKVDLINFRQVIKSFHKLIANTLLLLLIFIHISAIVFNFIFRKTDEIKRMI